MMNKFLIISLLITGLYAHAQDSNERSYKPQRLKLVAGTELLGYGGTMIGLYSLWYKDYPRSEFHLFNDNHGWQAIDKCGHAFSAYFVGQLGRDVLAWSGVRDKKALWYGGSLGWIFLSSVEIFDGFSAGWGFSIGDVIANTAGAALFIGQEYLWQEQRISMKFSYSPSPYQKYNPDVLGHNFQERLLKDYNGQTYWYTINLKSFFANNDLIPAWLNLAFGYGADGMLHGYQNPAFVNGQAVPQFVVFKQWYISPDFDLRRIKTNSKFLKTLFKTFSFVKVPMPALEYSSENAFRFHWLFF